MKKAFLVLAFLTITAILSADYKEALTLYENGQYDLSLKKISEELNATNDMTPNSPNYDLRFLAAHNYRKLGNLKAAATHLWRCAVIKKDQVAPYVDLAMIYIDEKKLVEAETVAWNGLKIGKSAMLYYVLGMASVKKNNFVKAKEYFEQANSLQPDLYYCYNALGISLFNLKKYGEANTAFSVANAINPNSKEILNNMGMSMEKLAKFKEALKYYEQARSLDKNDKTINGNIERVQKRIK